MYLDYTSYLLFAIALVLLVVGYLIKYRNATHLIAGYDEATVRDVTGLKKWVGGRTMLIGLVLSGLGFFFNQPRRQTVYAFAFLVAILAYNTVAGSQKFIK